MQGDITVNLIDTKSGVSIPLKFGQNTVGRGFEGITDKRCSRNQGKIMSLNINILDFIWSILIKLITVTIFFFSAS
jgi:hypothetical protein